MSKDIYMHGICSSQDYNFDDALSKLRLILRSKYLLSRRNLGITDNTSLFNGLDYISLCDYEKRTIENSDRQMYNAYYAYIMYSMALMFPKDNIDAINPIYINKALAGNRLFEYLMHKCGNSKNQRFSDYPDEVQVKNKISLDNLIGVTYPILSTYTKLRNNGLSKNDSILIIMNELEKLGQVLYDFDYGIGIYEANSLTLLDSEIQVQKVLKYHG